MNEYERVTRNVEVHCPKCGQEFSTPITVVVVPDMTRRDKAPLTLATAAYNPLRQHHIKAHKR